MPSYMWKEKREKKAFLALADGTIFHGVGFGAEQDTVGEVVFNTGMSGYQEILTDPSYAGQFVEITVAEVGFRNERQKVQIDLKKTMEVSRRFQLGTNGEIQSVSFGLYAAEPIKASDGKTIPKDGLIEILPVSADGTAVFLTDLPVGSKLYVKEYSTDEHYQISDQKYPVSFDYAGQEISTVHIFVNNGKPIENKLIRGNIHGKKVDEDGFSIAGAVFGLFAKDETEFSEETALLTAKSNEIGVFGFFDVPYGEYLVRELSCPPAFVLSEEIIPVTVSEQDQIVEITMENRFITGSVQVFKQDSETSAPIPGVVFQVYADVDRNKAFDPEIDRLAGELTETEAGVYQLDGLRYGGYFLREETAGEAYVKDDSSYYFFIETDGETVTVGNNGEIFVNKPVLGSVLIRKTDSETGEALSGAVFGLFDADGKEIRRGETDFPIYVDRTSHRYRYHHHSRLDADAGTEQGAGKGEERLLLEQPQEHRSGLLLLRQRFQRLHGSALSGGYFRTGQLRYRPLAHGSVELRISENEQSALLSGSGKQRKCELREQSHPTMVENGKCLRRQPGNVRLQLEHHPQNQTDGN